MTKPGSTGQLFFGRYYTDVPSRVTGSVVNAGAYCQQKLFLIPGKQENKTVAENKLRTKGFPGYSLLKRQVLWKGV